MASNIRQTFVRQTLAEEFPVLSDSNTMRRPMLRPSIEESDLKNI